MVRHALVVDRSAHLRRDDRPNLHDLF